MRAAPGEGTGPANQDLSIVGRVPPRGEHFKSPIHVLVRTFPLGDKYCGINMKPKNYVHLHVHSAFSIGAAICRIPALVQRAERLGFRALALTDAGNLYAPMEFPLKARAAGIKPIIGCEVEVAQPERPRRRTPIGNCPVGSRLVLLAANSAGYRNLVWLVSQSHLQSQGTRPCLRPEWLTGHGNGLIALSGGRRGELARAVLADDPRMVEESVALHVAAFGRDSFFIQLERSGAAGERQSEARLLALARRHRLATVATSDVRYMHRLDRPALECLRAMQVEEADGPSAQPELMAGASHLLSAEEMGRLFSDLPEAIENTLRVAERCELDLVEASRDSWGGMAGETAWDAALTGMVAKSLSAVYRVPVGTHPDGHQVAVLQQQKAGVSSSPATGASTSAIVSRANVELTAIHSAGLSRVLTAMGHLGQGLRRGNLPCVLRGPGNGSLVAYALGLSLIDPLRCGLDWKPWLASLVGEVVAVGIEVPDDQHEKVIALLRTTLSPDHVGGVTTFRYLHPRTLAEHLVRWGNSPEPDRHRFLTALWRGMSEVRQRGENGRGLQCAVLEAASGTRPAMELSRRRQFTKLIRIAWLLQDLPCQPGEALATFLVGTRALIESLPLARRRTGGTLVQFGLSAVDALGFLKVHLLGWEALRHLREAFRAVRAGDNAFTVGSIPLDDEKVITAILRNRSADKTGLLDPGGRQLALRLETRDLAGLAQAFALQSPLQLIAEALIARRKGLEASDPPHPLLADIVQETHGLVVFREQALQAIQRLTGWSAVEVVKWHRAHPRIGLPGQAAFIAACWKQHRLPKATAKTLLGQMQEIRRWKAEMVAKAQLIYWLTWLRLQHPQTCRAAGNPRLAPGAGTPRK